MIASGLAQYPLPVLAPLFAGEDRSWVDAAVCRGMDTNLFFPGRGDPVPAVVVEACAACPVAGPCLDYALSRPLHECPGVWGGTSERERRRIRRERSERREAMRCA